MSTAAGLSNETPKAIKKHETAVLGAIDDVRVLEKNIC